MTIQLLAAVTVSLLFISQGVACLAREGAVPRGSTPEALAATMRDDPGKWGKVINTARIKFERMIRLRVPLRTDCQQ